MSEERASLGLPIGATVGRYRVRQVHAEWGFYLTYLAEETGTSRLVLLHELLPEELVQRAADGTVSGRTERTQENLAWARERFLAEGHGLAACSHPAIQKIVDVFEANGTAYWVTPAEEGRSFKQWCQDLGHVPTEAELRPILEALLPALAQAHTAGLPHLNLKPETIRIAANGQPMLMHFAGSRQAIAQHSHEASAVTTGYSPIEQYDPEKTEGPATDIYSLAAVLHRAITGKAPPEATRRVGSDPYQKLAGRLPGGYSVPFLSAIDAALAPDATARPQNIESWSKMFHIGGGAKVPSPAPRPPRRVILVAAAAAAIVLAVVLWRVLHPTPPIPPKDDPAKKEKDQQAELAKKGEEEKQKAEEEKKADEEKMAEEKKKADEARLAEMQKKLEEQKKADEERQAAEKAAAEKAALEKQAAEDAAKKAEEAKAAEQAAEEEKAAAEQAAKKAAETKGATKKKEAEKAATAEAGKAKEAQDAAAKAAEENATAEVAAKQAGLDRAAAEKAAAEKALVQKAIEESMAKIVVDQKDAEAREAEKAAAEEAAQKASEDKTAAEQEVAKKAMAETEAADQLAAAIAAQKEMAGKTNPQEKSDAGKVAEEMAAKKAAEEKAAAEKAATEKAAAEMAAKKAAEERAKEDAARNASGGPPPPPSGGGGQVGSGLGGVWETTEKGPDGKPRRRLIIYTNAQYELSGDISDTGIINAKLGVIDMHSKNSDKVASSTFKYKSISMMETEGALGKFQWVRTAPYAAPKNKDEKK